MPWAPVSGLGAGPLPPRVHRGALALSMTLDAEAAATAASATRAETPDPRQTSICFRSVRRVMPAEYAVTGRGHQPPRK